MKQVFRSLLLLLVVAVVGAEPQPLPNESVVPLLEDSHAGYSDAIRRALSHVLGTMTGDPEYPSSKSGLAILARSDQFLQQYQLQRSTDPSGSKPQELFLRVQFSASGIEQALQEQKTPGDSIPQIEPAALVWLAVDDKSGRYMVGADSFSNAVRRFRSITESQDLHVLLPLLDLDDRAHVRVADVWSANVDVLQQASQRYGISSLLSGKLQQDISGHWRAQWTYWNKQGQQQWSSGQGALQDVLIAGINLIAHGSHDSMQPPVSVDPFTHLTVKGIESNFDYVRVEEYLRSLTIVRDLQVIEAGASSIRLSVELAGDMGMLDQLIAQGQVLDLLGDSPEKSYRLRP